MDDIQKDLDAIKKLKRQMKGQKQDILLLKIMENILKRQQEIFSNDCQRDKD